MDEAEDRVMARPFASFFNRSRLEENEMLEAAIVLGVIYYLALLALPGIELQIFVGGMVTLIGLLGGGSAGIVYHLVLGRALTRLGENTRGWLWSPVSRHCALDERGRREVLPWFRAGAVGFFLCLAGISMVAVALVRAVFTS
jgi:hypothetical protein